MDQTATLILAISLIIIMFGMGLSLTINDFRRIVVYPRAVLTGLVNQLVLLPIIGFGLAALTGARPEIAIGIIILAACPGGPTSNLITHLSKGDTALSVTLTAVSSMITIFSIPFLIQIGQETFVGAAQQVEINVPQIMLQLVFITILPVSLGMSIRKFSPAFAAKMDQPVKIASAIVFVLVLVGVIIKEKDNLPGYMAESGLLAMSLNVGTMALGYWSAMIMRLPRRQRISISIESGIQNGTLAIAIATVSLGNSEYAIAPATYGILMFITGFLMIGWGLRKADA